MIMILVDSKNDSQRCQLKPVQSSEIQRSVTPLVVQTVASLRKWCSIEWKDSQKKLK